LAISCECDAPHRAGVATETRQELAGLRIPQPSQPIRTASRNQFPIPAQRHIPIPYNKGLVRQAGEQATALHVG